MTLPSTREPPPRVQIQGVRPQLDCGRYPVKRTVGDEVVVTGTIFSDGHDVLGAEIRHRAPGESRWRTEPLSPLGNDEWRGSFTVDVPGRWTYTVAAWIDRVASWQDEIARKLAGGQTDLVGELSEGQALLGKDLSLEDARAVTTQDRHGEVVLDLMLVVDVEREVARFGAWYELFPRSFGGLKGVATVLPQLAELGFDVVYLTPIHPIGVTNRKGRNNAVTAKKGDVGSPWAIGGKEGGHTAIHPDLGTFDDFERVVTRGRELGIEIALDFAIQCSPDHPWLNEHPEWFHHRPDGTLKYAENPPKRYQDIYNVNFESEDWRELWQALLEVVLFWVSQRVRVFRVDNPHTKPVAFWEWLLAEVRKIDPGVVFLSEAFTRPAMMTTLAKVGFSQSYTYFTWKNSKAELEELMWQVLEWSEFYRPNFFANTPDILHEYLQSGGPPAFEARLVLAATLSPAYGIYSGYENYENVAVAEGSEEYLDSEKFEAKKRKLDGPLLPLVRRLNEVRRSEPALQRVENLRWLDTENELVVAYLKDDMILIVNLDFADTQAGVCVIPASLGLPPAFGVRDLLSGESYRWTIGRNYVSLEPGKSHVFKVGLGP